MKQPGNAIKYLLSLLLILACTSSAGAANKSFVWEVQSETATVFVHGSIHFAKPEMFPLAGAIEDGFERSANLVVEVNPVTLDQQKMQQLLVEKGMYSSGRTIRDDLSPEVFRMLVAHLEKNRIPLEKLERMRPGLLAMTLVTMQIMKLGYRPEYGIDKYFSLKAAREKKNILELETMEEQLDMLLNMPDENLYLKFTLQDLDIIEKLFNNIIMLWSSGDAAGMNEAILGPYEKNPEFTMILDKLFFARNTRMTDRIQDFLKTDQTYFVVVGAGHLVGDKGIITLLKKAHYKVRQL
ncbi:MAG: TraB/GumN family protein [Proteobacteria bacterium]|nr:TraB/GumN family protein [Pseudomonadota bacterium]MBU1737434.1 TraB/GumN family protein [Pseudomonadota bacterium]